MKTMGMMRTNKRVQKGVIFLALVLVLFVTGGTVVLSVLNNRQTAVLAQQQELYYQMEQAKAALLAYAASNATFWSDARGPGFFPCPDTDKEGIPDSSCDSDVALLGRLPEYEDIGSVHFRLNSTYATTDQQFWYVVGPRYVYHSTNDLYQNRSRNRTSNISVNATPYRLYLDNQSEYVAFIIAPGEELSTQDRAAGPTNYANYLDGQNGANGFYYTTSYPSNPELFNDQVIGITLDEYMKVVGTVAANGIKKGIDIYHAGTAYPDDTTASSAFRNYFDNTDASTLLWLDTDSTGADTNGERWGNYVTWDRTSNNTGTLYFTGCTGITYTLTYGGSIVRSGTSC